MTNGKRKEIDERYHSKWRKIVNVMAHSNLRIAKIAKAGSRAIQKHRDDSDMDVIFSVVDNPSKEDFHPKLIQILYSNFRNDSVYAGSNNNVVHLDFQTGEKFDLVLLSGNDFDEQHEEDVNYRKENL